MAALVPGPASAAPSGELPAHVAIIMDGNGRWASARGRSRAAGHAEGARAVRRVVEAARRFGISTLTLYAFSADNWKRPAAEVAGLMALFAEFLRAEVARCRAHGIRLAVVGRRDRLGIRLRRAIEDAERGTERGRAMCLRIAIDYSARDAIVRAAALAARAPGAHSPAGPRVPSRDGFARLLARATHAPEPAPDVDLLIRTGGERRLSDFLLWECAYAELVFTDRMWPEFGAADLADAIAEYGRRERRFGALACRDARSA
ncbi:MAG TPA: polyprenyl diphosphate synthase [Gemmatimonadaceae bacterium]|nr:polyprenyl diphosphate synthase [Gemmatimonadaceae bacterium]